MSPRGGSANKKTSDDIKLARNLAKNLAVNESLNQYNKDIIKWANSIDRGYAWLVLVALWLMMVAILGPYRLYGLVFAHVTEAGVYTREEASWPVAAILTIECLLGPVVSIVAYKISFTWSMLIGTILVILGNGLAGISNGLALDVVLIGFVQGVGYAFIFMPFMDVINNYFYKYRNLALGLALCGGTMSVFAWSPVFQWLLANYPWRYSYFGLGALCSLGLLTIPILRPNPKPKFDPLEQVKRKTSQFNGSSLSKMSIRALSYQGSSRRQSTILVARQTSNAAVDPANGGTITSQGLARLTSNLSRQGSVVSVHPFARSVGIERKISSIAMAAAAAAAAANNTNTSKDTKLPAHFDRPKIVPRRDTADSMEVVSLSEVQEEAQSDDENQNFELSIIWDILKTPAFHFIWFNELIYFWVFSIYCLVIVDYGEDRGCTRAEAESLLKYQSLGELVGRLVLSGLVDLKLLSSRHTVILLLLTIAGTMVLVTQVSGFYFMASITASVAALCSLLYIMLNSLLVEYLGERKVTIAFGMASCIGGVLMSFRPQLVGYFRDQHGSYDPIMICFASACTLAAILWSVEPLLARLACKSSESGDEIRKVSNGTNVSSMA